MKNKKVFAFIVVAVLVILLIIYFFYKNTNKKSIMGNNFSNKTNQQIEEYILNISSYEADIEVEIKSNKNSNKYKIKQTYISPNIEKQVVEEPSNIKGLETIYDGKSLKITNTKFNLNTVYENYPYISDNFLWLNSFIQDYKTSKNRKLYEEQNELVMEVILETDNPYASSKKLYINKNENRITKLIVQDKNKKSLVYILYNEIKINSLEEGEVLAFKIKEISAKQY